jgi:3-isopropylmalate/(R)-2-methylmalate dehydratase small subunit
MKTQFTGRVYVVVDDIDTDVIIPARYLTSMDPNLLRPHLFEDLPDKQLYEEGMNVIVAGKNFGCGSSREHAPIAIAAAGFEAVVAKSFARIFWRNAINGGKLLPLESVVDLSKKLKTGDNVNINLDALEIINESERARCVYPLKPLDPFVKEIIEAGGLTAYNKRRMGLFSFAE